MRVAVLISDRVDFRTRKIIRDKERYYIIILQEDTTVFNVHAHNHRASNYMRQKLIELQGTR